MATHFTWQSAVIRSDMRSETKLTLLVIGSHMDQHGLGCFPSIATIARFASLAPSTVRKHVALAKDLGWINVKRRSRNGENETNFYSVSFPRHLDCGGPGTPANGVGTPANGVGVHRLPVTNTPVEHPNEHKTRSPRVSSGKGQKDDDKAKTISKVELIAEHGIDAELAQAFLEHRKAKKAKLTDLAWKGFIREAKKSGWTLSDAIRKTIERNWVGFEAEWVAKPQPGQKNAATGPAGGQDGDWWESASEIERRAADLGMTRNQGELFQWFKCRVAKACKERRWMDLILADLLRTKSSHYARVYEYFNGTPPMEGI